MSAKAGFPLALVMTVVGLCSALGANPPAAPEEAASPILLMGGTEVAVTGPAAAPVIGPAPMPVGPAPMPVMGPAPMPMIGPAPLAGPTTPGTFQPAEGTIAQSSGLSSWIRYTKPDCCGPIGGHGPIMSELYMRNGPSIPTGGGVLGAVLDAGWMFQGGGRSLFFNSDMTWAWVVDLGISYNYNHGVGNRTVSLVPPGADNIGPSDLHLRQLQRTAANLAVGRETYLYVWPDNGPNLRGGFHVGGQLGTIKADWREIRHTTDMLWAITLAMNLDLEIPWGCCTLLGGFRVEWNDIFESDIVQHQNNNNLQSVNLLVTGGFRF